MYFLFRYKYADVVFIAYSMIVDQDNYLMLSGVQHFAFCERRWALVHIEKQWQENYLTSRGKLMHKNVDNPFYHESRRDVIISRAVPLVSHTLQLYGVADVVEFHQSDTGITLPKYDGQWIIVPVEYKSGNIQDGDFYELQLCAQAICLEEMFKTKITRGFIYYGKARRRSEVLFDEELRQNLLMVVRKMYHLFEVGVTPPANYQKYCEKCSMIDVCLPHSMSKRLSANEYMNSMF